MLNLGAYTTYFGQSFYMLVFAFGLILGSFLNSVIWRLRDNIAIFTRSRSMCTHCRKQLSWKENIPLVSWLFLRGKCLHCQKDISLYYPLVELGTAVVFTLIVYQYFPNAQFSEWSLVRDLFFITTLVLIFVQDLRYQEISSDVVWVGAIVGLAINTVFLHKDISSMALGALIGGGFFMAQYVISKGRWIGGGDVRMGAMMGIWLGWPNVLVALFLAYILGAIIGVYLLITKKAGKNTEIPFGTFLSVGTLVALYFGDGMVSWYALLLK